MCQLSQTKKIKTMWNGKITVFPLPADLAIFTWVATETTAGLYLYSANEYISLNIHHENFILTKVIFNLGLMKGGT